MRLVGGGGGGLCDATCVVCEWQVCGWCVWVASVFSVCVPICTESVLFSILPCTRGAGSHTVNSRAIGTGSSALEHVPWTGF
jgi:hypothetical protein